MIIWIDADACPRDVKDITFKTSQRLQIKTMVISNHFVRTPPSPLVQFVQVSKQFDAADQFIIEHIAKNHIVITGDISFADKAIALGAIIITPKGEHLSAENIKDRLSMRNLMEEMRGGLWAASRARGPDPYSAKDAKNFAAMLDKMTATMRKV